MKRGLFLGIGLVVISSILIAAETNLQSTKVIEGLKNQIGLAGNFIKARFEEQTSAPGTPASGLGIIYEKSDNVLYFKDDAGLETSLLGAGGGGGGASQWKLNGSTLYPTSTAYLVAVGAVSSVNSSRFGVDGITDVPQVSIQGNATQTDSTLIIEQSDGTEVFTVEDTGTMTTAVGLDAIGAVNLAYGSPDVVGHDFEMGTASGNDLTVNTSLFVVEGDTGHVGVGTSTPTSSLHIEESTTTSSDNDIPQVKIVNPHTTDGSTYIRTKMGTGYGGGYPELWISSKLAGEDMNEIRGVSNHPLAFRTNDVERARIAATGLLTAKYNLTIGNTTTSAGVLTIDEDDDDGSNNATFTVPALAADTDYTLPPDDGDAGEQLQTDGSGILTWEAAATASFTDIDTDYGTETVTADWRFSPNGTGAHGAYDLTVGTDTAYGALNIGNFGLYSSSFSANNLDLDKAILFRQEGNIGAGNDPGIEFAWMEQGNTVRMAIPESASGNATAMIRSVTIAGPYTSTLGNTIVTGDTWTAYDSNLDFDTGGSGADLFVMDDIELEGTLFVSGGDIRLDSDDANPLIISATSQTASHGFDFPDDEIVSTDILIGDAAGSFVYAPLSGGATMTNAGVVTVVTNANLTGHITSTGNAAILGAFTEAQLETAVSDDNPLFDGDIGGSVQAQDAELDTIAALTETNGNVMFVAGGAWTSDATPAIDGADITNLAIVTGDITDGTILEADLNVTNSPTDNWILSANTGAGNFTWVEDQTAAVGTATTSMIDAGTSTSMMPVDQFEDSDFAKKTVSVLINDSTGLTTGDGKAYFRVPDELAGWSITQVRGARTTGTGTDTYMLHNFTQGADVLSTALWLDATELDSNSAGTSTAINSSEDDVTLYDRYRIDIDAVGSSTTWAEVQVTFERLP